MRTAEPRRNRVTPTGEIVAVELRGAWTGNRGILHRDEGAGARIVRSHAGIAWIICRLRFGDRRIPQWSPGHYTPLFFLDEAVALAAGHRPCAQCRRAAFRSFLTAAGTRHAPELDRVLDEQRRIPRTCRRRWHDRPWAGLPDGTFVGRAGDPDGRPDGPWLVLGDRLIAWTPAGYGRAEPRPIRGRARVLTPPATVAALHAGYRVQIDDAARRPAGQTGPGTRSTADGSSSATDR
ncbi:hypothetical protein [Nakamurella sp.]|uniref:hypothetical protein n=1 Tax=Nakamurella sp. TaxID=1869182 RepID=UPI003B3B114F